MGKYTIRYKPEESLSWNTLFLSADHFLTKGYIGTLRGLGYAYVLEEP